MSDLPNGTLWSFKRVSPLIHFDVGRMDHLRAKVYQYPGRVEVGCEG